VADRTATGLRTLDLGTAPPGTPEPILWTNEHAGAEVYQFVRASAVPAAKTGEPAGTEADLADLAMVSVEIPLQYAVTDVQLFDELTVPERRDDLLRATAQRQITLYMQQLTLDDVLGGKRTDISAELRARVQAAFDNLNPGPDGKARGAGVEVVFLGISGVHPPKEAATAFETPVQADQRREAAIESARADAIEQLTQVVGDVGLARSVIHELDELDKLGVRADPAVVAEQEFKVQQLLEKAGGGASSLLASARATRWQLHMGSRGRAARYQGQLALYNAAPELYRSGQYFEALRTAMLHSRVYITSDQIPELRTDLDLQDKDLGVDIFKKE